MRHSNGFQPSDATSVCQYPERSSTPFVPRKEKPESATEEGRKRERTESPEAAAATLVDEEKGIDAGATRGLALLPPPPPRVLRTSAAARGVRARRSIIQEGSGCARCRGERGERRKRERKRKRRSLVRPGREFRCETEKKKPNALSASNSHFSTENLSLPSPSDAQPAARARTFFTPSRSSARASASLAAFGHRCARSVRAYWGHREKLLGRRGAKRERERKKLPLCIACYNLPLAPCSSCRR